MKAKAIFVFIILSFLTLLSAESAVASPDSTARSERQRYIVDAALRGPDAVVVEVYGNGDYVVTLSLVGQTKTEMSYGVRHGVTTVPSGELFVVSVAAIDGGARCRIYDRSAKVLAQLDGGNAVTCSWSNR